MRSRAAEIALVLERGGGEGPLGGGGECLGALCVSTMGGGAEGPVGLVTAEQRRALRARRGARIRQGVRQGVRQGAGVADEPLRAEPLDEPALDEF